MNSFKIAPWGVSRYVLSRRAHTHIVLTSRVLTNLLHAAWLFVSYYVTIPNSNTYFCLMKYSLFFILIDFSIAFVIHGFVLVSPDYDLLILDCIIVSID